MAEELVVIARFPSALEAEAVRNYLETEGVQAFLDNENTAVLFSGILTEANVQVAVADAARARELLAKLPSTAGDVEEAGE